MKPRTKIQIDVMKCHKELPSATPMLSEWAIKVFKPNVAYATKHRAVCMNCGNKFSTKIVHRKKAICPHCNSKLKIELTSARSLRQSFYFTYLDIFKGYQVVRNFEFKSHSVAGKRIEWLINEVLQEWIRNDRKMVIVSRLHNRIFSSDCWQGGFEIRKNRGYSYYDSMKYSIYPDKYYPRSKIKNEYRKYGISTKIEGISVSDAIRIIPDHPIAETLLKSKQYHLLYYFEYFQNKMYKYWGSIRICLRNNYYINDAQMWFDYLNLLEECGKDLRNSHYVCPPNLKEEHDKYMTIRRKAIEKERRIEMIEKAKESEESYRAFIRRFEGLLISDGELVIEPLKSVADFIHEGDTMHHCVFTNSYYKNRDSLILSAKMDDERIETVQFDLDNYKVVQSKGKFNGITEYHDKIVQLVEKNFHKIRLMNENALVFS